MFIVSSVYFILLFYAVQFVGGFTDIYAYTQPSDIRNYSINMLHFSIIFVIVISTFFNISKIPLQYPKKWKSLLNIDNKYFSYAYILVFISSFAASFLYIFGIDIGPAYAFVFVIISSLFMINKIDLDIEIKTANYTIIEQVIFTFLLILAISLVFIIDDFNIITDMIFNGAPPEFTMMVTLSYTSILIIILSLIHIYYIEKTITNPIYDLIDELNKTKAEDMINTEDEANSRLQSYLDRNDDISRLVDSFELLKGNIGSYLSQIKETSEEKDRIETEFNVASEIQSNMIKTDFEEFSKDREFEIFGFMNPAKEVGGDFYDYFDIDEENIGFAIGDVCGKGIPATLLMVKTMYLIRNHNKINEDPEEAMRNVNKLSCERNDEGLFATTVYGKLNLKSGKLLFVNAGHNPPLIKNNSDNNFEYMDIKPNFVLGEIEQMEYEKEELTLNPGDMIFLYSDGIIEANKDFQGFYGEDRLKDALNNSKDKSLKEIVEGIKDDVYAFCKGEDQFDDMTMLIIKYTGCESNE